MEDLNLDGAPAGFFLEPEVHSISLERQIRFSTWFRSGAIHGGVFTPLGPNVHTDPEFCREHNIPAPAVSAPWYYGLLYKKLLRTFGRGLLEGGYLKIHSIKVLECPAENVSLHLVVKESRKVGDGTQLVMDAWVENADGEKVAVGEAGARLDVPAGKSSS